MGSIWSSMRVRGRDSSVRAMIKSWQQGLTYYKSHKTAAQALIAKDLGATLKDLASSFKGISFYTTAQSKAALTGGYAKTLKLVNEFSVKAGLISKPVSTSAVIDARFVK
jgi:NitT/TauT family transport system substrate-binding protein